MTIQIRRTQLGWTQEQLADHAGVSIRTVQRIENGSKATLETLKCLAATFDVSIAELTREQAMQSNPLVNEQSKDRDILEEQALEYVASLKIFHMNWITALVVIPCLAVLNYFVSPSSWWVTAVIGGWVLAILLHGLFVFDTFSLLGAGWEQKQFQKRLKQLKR